TAQCGVIHRLGRREVLLRQHFFSMLDELVRIGDVAVRFLLSFNRHGSSQEFFTLLAVALNEMNQRKVLERTGDVAVVGTIDFFVNRELALIERFRLSESPLLDVPPAET